MGIINVLEGFLCRYSEFPVCLERVKKPDSTMVLRHQGVGITNDLNHAFGVALHEGHDWVWMLDDDCVFHDDFLCNLLERDVDIVVPFSLDSEFPHLPQLYEKDYSLIDKYWLCKQEGIVETELLTVYSGMLVKKNVIEALDQPWFINGATMTDRLGADIRFCQMAIEAGFKIHIDFENTLGRIAHFSMWASNHEGRYSASVLRPVPWG